MIFSTFILTLVLLHIARAIPACGDVAAPFADAQHALPIVVYNVTWSSRYDNKNGDTNKGACKGLSHLYPHYKDFPDFPYIGGVWNVKWDSENCGLCWNLTSLKTHKTISVAAVDHTVAGYNISKKAYMTLNGGKVGSGTLQAEAKQVDIKYCGFTK